MKKLVCLMLFIVSLLAGCSSKSELNKQQQIHGNKLIVYTTIYPLHDFTINVGGDMVNVHNLVPSGADPHVWEPSPRTIANLTEADLIIYCGAGLEPWVDKIINNIDASRAVIVNASSGVELLIHDEQGQCKHGHRHIYNGQPHDAARIDPHIWLDPLNAKIIVENIKEGLIAADPGNSLYFKNRTELYHLELEQLNKEYSEALANVKRRSFVTSHAAFGYLARRYDINQIPIRGLSPEIEPTPARISDVIRIVKDQNVEYIFFETLVGPKVSEAIASETGARVLSLNTLESLTMEEILGGSDYLSVMRDNLANLVIALGGGDV